jgi:hypothetical protein
MRARLTLALGIFLFLAIIWATWNGWSRGGQDFGVFHYAGRLVLQGRWEALYVEGPDRFLYAPGFALLMSPLAILPKALALALWLAATVGTLFLTLRALARRYGYLATGLATLFFLRSIAIDLRYGQVNLFILAASVFALLAWSERENTRASARRLGWSWFLFSIAAFSKIYPLALFILPAVSLFRDRKSGSSVRALIIGSTIGAVVLLLPPLFVSGVYPAWFEALGRKGLPTETHNQSLLAFLTRIFSGEPFYPLALGGEPILFKGFVFSAEVIRGVWLGFSVLILAFIGKLAWNEGDDERNRPLVGWLLLGLCFLPAHLIWKSYFVLGIPLVTVLFSEAVRNETFRAQILKPAIVAGCLLCFTSIDFVGVKASVWIEAFSPFFWVQSAAVLTGLSLLSARSSRSYS